MLDRSNLTFTWTAGTFQKISLKKFRETAGTFPPLNLTAFMLPGRTSALVIPAWKK